MIRELFPSETARSVFAIDYERLYRLGYRALLFDIDNTLVHHGDDSTPQVDALFKKINGIGFRTLMLSNNNEERILRFLKNIDADYIDEAGKPDPACYIEACSKLGVQKEQAVMIAYILFYSTIFLNLIPYCDIEKNNSPICVRDTKNHKQICEFI